MSLDSEHLPETPSGPFEGPEKLLEIWFAPSPAEIPHAILAEDGKIGLRKVPRAVWEEMLDIVKCKVLSVVEGLEMDAYLLRWVAFMVHRVHILRTVFCTFLAFHLVLLYVVLISCVFKRIVPLRFSTPSDPQNVRNDSQSARSSAHTRDRKRPRVFEPRIPLFLLQESFHVS